MISFDTNIVVHSANRDSPYYEQARGFLEDLGSTRGVVVCELMLVEVFLKLCNAKIFRSPMSSAEAGPIAGLCGRTRTGSWWSRRR
jgi:predicted nucleic acid-binding protein